MIKAAITGNIASGKSVVEKLLSSKYPVIDTDVIAHEILEDNQEVIKAFKDFDILENGKISRQKLGKVVFSDGMMKQVLEGIIHPEVQKKIEQFFEQNTDKKIVFVSVPLLFETGMNGMFDKVIMIYADDDIRLKRLMKRNNLLSDDALMRINSQMLQDRKVLLSDFVIYNNGTAQELSEQVTKMLYQVC